MLTLRFKRIGKKNRPFFRLVVSDKRRHPKKGESIDEVGFYDPIKKDVKVDKERVLEWLKKGVKPSDTCHNLLVRLGVIEGKKIAKHKKKKVKEGEEEQQSQQAQSQAQQQTQTQQQSEPQTADKPKESQPTDQAQPVEKSEDKSGDNKQTEDKNEKTE